MGLEVTVEEAMTRLVIQPEYDDGLGPRPCVHTFLGGIGAHWGVEELRAHMEKHGVAETDGFCLGHDLVVIDERNRALFIEATKP